MIANLQNNAVHKKRDMFSILFWRILRTSKVFNYWYKKHLTELLYDLELYDLEKDEILLKWRNRERLSRRA